jgi:putative hydrolase of the HAD superfamily
MTVRALFFDLDDTLIDDQAAVRHGAECVCSAHSGDLPAGTDHYAVWQTAFALIYPRFVRGELTFPEQRRARVRQVFALPDLGDEEADRRFATYLEGYRCGTRLFADVIPALDRLAQLPLGVITNSQAGLPESKLRTVGIRDRFRIVADPDSMGVRKPDAAIFHAACRALGVDGGDALHVGDHPELDARAAIAAGLGGWWLNRNQAQPQQSLPTITSLAQLQLHGVEKGVNSGRSRSAPSGAQARRR